MPSQPQTGRYSRVQTSGFFRQKPVWSAAPQVPTGKSQKSFSPQVSPWMPPHSGAGSSADGREHERGEGEDQRGGGADEGLHHEAAFSRAAPRNASIRSSARRMFSSELA